MKPIDKLLTFVQHITNYSLNRMIYELQRKMDLDMQDRTKEIIKNHANPLNRFGRKAFSQTDEDGITIEILRRMDSLGSGCYAEFGVGDGLENNTLILAALGWRGFWGGGENLAFKAPENSRFIYYKFWIVLDNIINCIHSGMKYLKTDQVDVISLDLDGNDIYFVEKILSSGIKKPKLFIVEYNGKFIPPIEFQIDYNPKHQWDASDYSGASLTSFVKLFTRFGYKLVCCNAHSGTNAFFIDDQYSHLFADVPEDIDELFVEPRYHVYNSYAHDNSPKTVELILRDSSMPPAQ